MLLPTSLLPIRPGRFLLAFAAITALILWHFHVLNSTQPVQIAEALHEEQTIAGLANSTLGFQIIIAISSEDASSQSAWRQRGLLAAADRTGLDISLHQSRHIPEEELRAFRQRASKSGETPRLGSAKAWIAHLDALKYISKNDISTALILEDDADWDVRIRYQLAPDTPIPSLVRAILTDPPSDTSFDHAPKTESPASNSSLPYTLDYDILWLGHCSSVKTPYSRQLLYRNDATLPPALELRALHDRYAYTPEPNYTRTIMRSPGPTCSYAYAVTLKGARRLIERASKGGAAFDNELGAACSAGEHWKKGGLKCVSVAPELFHHQRVISKDGSERESSIVEKLNWAEADGSPAAGELKMEKKGTKKVEKVKEDKRRFITFNIMYSARCNAGNGDEKLAKCLPTDDELDRYTT